LTDDNAAAYKTALRFVAYRLLLIITLSIITWLSPKSKRSELLSQISVSLKKPAVIFLHLHFLRFYLFLLNCC